MLKKMAALVALAAGLAMAPVGPAVADTYSPQVPTQTSIEIVVGGPGQPITVRVAASANNPAPPRGSIAIQISGQVQNGAAARSAQAAPVFASSVRFEGQRVTLTGPRLPQGRYVATAALTPDDKSLFLASDTTTSFRVRGAVGGEKDTNDDNDAAATGGGSGLPNTGGPDLMWLLLGASLVAVGGGTITAARRRREPALA